MNCQRRFRDANLLQGNVFSQKWSVSVCLVLCDPEDTGTFRFYSQANTSERAIDINVGKPVFFVENSNLYMLHFSAMFMVGTIFFWGLFPP